MPQKSISSLTFFFGNLATGHFEGKMSSRYTISGHTGSNHTESVALPGAESIAVQTDIFGYYNIGNNFKF